MLRDLRYTLRGFRRTPGHTALALVTLALGIGVTTAGYSVVYGSFYRALSQEGSDRLVKVSLATSSGNRSFSATEYFDLLTQAERFDAFSAATGGSVSITGQSLPGPGPEVVPHEAVTPNMFPALGAQPTLGRNFSEREGRPGAPPVAILSYDLWQRRFAGNPAAIGETLSLAGVPHTVVGVMGRAFVYCNSPGAEVWTPLALSPNDANRTLSRLSVVGKLKPGASSTAAQAELDGISARLAQSYPATNKDTRLLLRPMRDYLVRGFGEPVKIAFVATLFLLLIACCNLASLLLARSAGRAREMAVRAALGAGRRRLIRQLLLESVTLAVAGGAAGLFVATSVLDFMHYAFGKAGGWTPEMRLDWPVLAFSLGVSIVTGLLFGLAPALHASDFSLADVLRGASDGRRRNRVLHAVVVGEIALSVVLLAGAGVLVRNFAALMSVDLGLNAPHVITMYIPLPEHKYSTDVQIASFSQSILAQVGSLPEVRAAAAANALPLSDSYYSDTLEAQGKSFPASGGDAVKYAVTPNYFRTLGIPLLAGRQLDSRDSAAAPRVAVIAEAAARRFWPGYPAENPVGQHIRWRRGEWAEVVGIVGDVRHSGPRWPAAPAAYQPLSQAPASDFYVIAASAGDPHRLVRPILERIRALDSEQPATRIRTLDESLADRLGEERLAAEFFGFLGAVALMLAVGGLYGVMSYSAAQSTREVGIRIALGAESRSVVRLLLRRAGKLVAIGMAFGLAGALALTRFLGFLLVGVEPRDPLVFVAVTALLAGAAMLAAWLPARRATRTDPMVALRAE